jgi:lysophospholipase L1-like esterase
MSLSSPRSLAIGCVLLFATVTIVLFGTAPDGVPVGAAIGQLAMIVGGLGALCVGLFAVTLPKGDPGRWAQTIRSTSVVVGFVIIGGGIRAALDLGEAGLISADLLVDTPALGPGAALLRPNMRNARVVAPDRPHNPQDIFAGNRLDRTTRTRAFLVNTNSQGFRGPEFDSPAPGFRIAAVGDSVTFGWGVSDDQSWPAQLHGITNIEVLNLGIPAGETEMLTRLVVAEGKKWDADIVLFSEWPEFMRAGHWKAYSEQVARLRTAIAPAKLAIVLPPVSTFDPLRMAVEHGAIDRVRSIVGDVPVLDLSEPFKAQKQAGVVLQTQDGQQQLIRVPTGEIITQGAGAPDRLAPEIISAFEADSTLAEPLFFDGGHPTVEGNRVAAQAIASWLRELGWIPHS